VILTAKQTEANALLQTSAKHILLDGGSRSGKSALFVRAICSRAIKAPASRHAILRFRFNHCKESIGMDTLPAVMTKCFPQVPYTINKSDWFAQLPNKSEIWLGGLDDKERTEKILGKEYATLYLNEASARFLTTPATWRSLVLLSAALIASTMLNRELALKMYYDCNPPGKGTGSTRCSTSTETLNPSSRYLSRTTTFT
jgi:hypothetical protein